MSDLKELETKIKNGKLKLSPFPHLIIKKFLSKKNFLDLNKALPHFDELVGKDIFKQSNSDTKRSVFFESEFFINILRKEKKFAETIKNFKKIEKVINKKFKDEINKYVELNFSKSKTKFSCSLSICKKNYVKSIHVDRREHKFAILYYPQIQKNSGGELCLWSTKKKEVYDVFPDKKNLRMSKTIKATPNTCVITLNTPSAYHSVKKYNGKIDRKYIYAVYDFPSHSGNYKLKSRIKGNNENNYWKEKVKIFSKKRFNRFFTE